MILCQGGVKMILVDRYDHRIYYYGRKQLLKINRITTMVDNTQNLIFEFEYL
jgi:hypothetical protein